MSGAISLNTVNLRIIIDIMTNYYQEISLERWQIIANQACYETNQQIKTQAQNFFHMFLRAPNLNIIISILNNGSDTLIFVMMSYLNKNRDIFGNNMQNFVVLMQTIKSWQFKGFNFIRHNMPPFKKFVTRTIMNSIGTFLKVLYENQQTSRPIVNYLQQLEANYFKLFILKTFVEVMEVVDTQMGFMKYRTMIYSFQDNIMPMICETLMPFFYSIQEGVRICELAVMQQNLKVNEQQTEVQNYNLPISKEQEMQSQYVFMLLKKIVEFNYNITYTEYESEMVIDTCLITFPDSILQKIINFQFLNALLFIIDKVSEVKVGTQKNEYLSIGLDCLAKMMQSRLIFIGQQKKQKFILHSVQGLVHLLQKCQQIGSQALLQGILICNQKLFINVEINYIKQLVHKDAHFSSINLYKTYINSLTDMIVLVIKKSDINIDNHLLTEAIQIFNKLMASLRFKDDQNIDQEQYYFMGFVKLVIDAFITSLCQPRSIFHGKTLLSIAENKQAINHLFDTFKKAACYNYGYLFEQLLAGLDYFLTYSKHQSIVFANILLFLSELIDHNFLDRNIYLNRARNNQIVILGILISRCTELVKEYIESRRFIINKQACYIDTAVLIFSEAILTEFLIGFQATNGFKIKQRLYMIMNFGQNYSEIFQSEDYKSQQTIQTYLNYLLQYLQCPIANHQDEIKMLYVFDVIQRFIFKLKWNLKRQSFLKSPLFKMLSVFFQNFFYNFNTIMDIRSRAGKIMVTLTFDDILDQYKLRINKFLNILKTQQLQIMLYDLIGIFEGIQTNAISKYFCQRLKKQMDLSHFFQLIFQFACIKNEQKIYKDVCRLYKSIITNKGLKISNSIITYEFFSMILPNIINLIKNITRTNPINYDLWGQSIFQLIEMFSGVINGTHINIFLLDFQTHYNRNNPRSLCKQYMIEFFQLIMILANNLQTYPRLQEILLQLLISINKQILDYLYCDQSGQLSYAYNMIMIVMINLLTQYINQILDGNKILEDKLIKVIDCLRTFYMYFNKKCKITHKKVRMDNLQQFYEISENCLIGNDYQSKNEKLIYYLISFILTNHKNNIAYLRIITKFIHQLNKNFNNYILTSLNKLNINQFKLNQVQIILSNQNENQQIFIQCLKAWIRDFNEFK